MKTITIQLRHSKALKILKDLEDADLIKLVSNQAKKKSSLSKSLRGSITVKKSKELRNQLELMRSGWNRNTL